MVNQFQLTFTIKNNINKTGVSVQVTTQAKCVCPNSCYSFWYFYTNNSDYLQKARKYGHFTGYKN